MPRRLHRQRDGARRSCSECSPTSCNCLHDDRRATGNSLSVSGKSEPELRHPEVQQVFLSLRDQDNTLSGPSPAFDCGSIASSHKTTSRFASFLVGFACGLVLFCSAATALAAAPNQATSSRAAREDAIRSIPLDKLDAKDKERISAAISGASIYRRLPVQVTECDPDLYLVLVRHPEVIVNIWEVMTISNVALQRTGPDTFRASDGVGTLCSVKFCYSNHEIQVIYAEGSYDGPLFVRPVRAKCVLVLRSGYVQETDGRYFVTSRMDTFIQIEHVGVEFLAKALQPLVNQSADYNFVETAAFVSTVSRTAEANAAGMSRFSKKLLNVEPDVRKRFGELALEVGKKARRREALQALNIGPPLIETSQKQSAQRE